MSKDLMVLVPLKKTLTFYFARVCLYCSLRPLMYDVTTPAPSINFSVERPSHTMSYKTTTTPHISVKKAKKRQTPTDSQWKAKPIHRKFIEGARVVIPYIIGLSEQYRHTLAKYKVRVFFKGTSTIKSLLMHPIDPSQDRIKK